MLLSSSQPINLDTEIRKLQPAHIYKLSMILNISDSWKKVMSMAPKDNSGQYIFGSDHLSLIEQASQQQKRSCAEIFFDEWSTMGRKRPTVGNLLELLGKAELYRAADYIAIDLLNWKEGLKRPKVGPAAPINISMSLLKDSDDIVESAASVCGDVYVERSFVNEEGNLQDGVCKEHLPEEIKVNQIPINKNEHLQECKHKESIPEKIKDEVSQIPAFLNNVRFSNFSEAFIEEKSLELTDISFNESHSSELVCQANFKIDHTAEDAYKSLHNGSKNEPAVELGLSTLLQKQAKVPSFLNDTNFTNYSEIIEGEKSSNKEPCPNVGNVNEALPRFLNEITVSSFVSKEVITAKNVQELPLSISENKSLSEEKQLANPVPVFLNETNFSNITQICESENSSNIVSRKSSESNYPKINQELNFETPCADKISENPPCFLNESTLLSFETQELLSNSNESAQKIAEKKVTQSNIYLNNSSIRGERNTEEDIQEEFLSNESHQIPAFLKGKNFSNFSEIVEGEISSNEINKASSEVDNPKATEQSHSEAFNINNICKYQPRFLNELTLSSFLTQEVSTSCNASMQNPAESKLIPESNICVNNSLKKEKIHAENMKGESSSNEAYQVPTFMNDTNFSNFSVIVEDKTSLDEADISSEINNPKLSRKSHSETFDTENVKNLPLFVKEMTHSSFVSQDNELLENTFKDGPDAKYDLTSSQDSNSLLVDQALSFSGKECLEICSGNVGENANKPEQAESISNEKNVTNQIPVFLNDTKFIGFSNFSEIENSSNILEKSSKGMEEFYSEAPDIDKICAKLPNCLDKMTLSSFESEEIIPKSDTESLKDSLKNNRDLQNDLPRSLQKNSNDIVDSASHSEKLCKENSFADQKENSQEGILNGSEATHQIPTFLNDIDFSNFSKTIESEKLSDKIDVD